MPLFDEMMDEKILGKNMFAFFMSMNPKDEESEVMFGDWNETKIHENAEGEKKLDWHPVVHQLFWSLKLDDVLIDGESLGLCGEKVDCRFTPDTGTSLLTFP